MLGFHAQWASQIRSWLLPWFVFPLAACQTHPTAPWPIPPEARTAWVNGYPMAYLERGSGPVAVLVHGTNADYRHWESNVGPMSDGRRVIAVSLRHFYPEPWDGKGNFSAREHADDLIAFVEHLRAGPVDLIAHSRGGLVAADALVRRPELFRKVVLAEPAIPFDPPPPLSQDTPFNRFQRGVNERFEKDGAEAGLAQWHELFGKGIWQGLPAEERTRRLQNAWTVTRLSDIGVPCASSGRFEKPVLFVSGADSPALFKTLTTNVSKCFASPKFVTIPKAAHPMNRHNPAAFNEAVTTFLSE